MLTLNPAAMTLTRGWELVYLHAEVSPAQAVLPGKGDAIYATANVFGPLFLGVGLEFVRPPRKVLMAHHDFGLTGSSWTLATFSMGMRLGDSISLGTSIRSWFSPADQSRMHGLVSWDLALHVHTSRYWSAFASVYDITSPTKGGIRPVERTWALGAAFRPLGRDVLTFSVDDFLGESSLNNTLRVSIEAEPVRGIGIVASASLLFGRGYPFVPDPADLDGKHELRDVQISIGLTVDLAHIGAMTGFTLSAMGPQGGWDKSPLVGWLVGVRLSGQKHKSVMALRRYAVLELEGEMGASTLVSTVLWLDRMSRDRELAGVVLEPRGFSASPGAIQDLRGALDVLRAAGKQVVCHSDETSGSAYYLCSAADVVYLGPSGGIRLSGYKMRLLFFTGLLAKLGVNVQMVRIGKYKSYPETLTLDEPSDASLEEHMELLEQVWAALVADVAAGRGKTPDEMEEILAEGPFNAEQAVTMGLADAVIYEDELEQTLGDLTGHKVFLDRGYLAAQVKPDQWGPGPRRVGIITVGGGIVEGKSTSLPVLGIQTSGDKTLVKALDAARKDPGIGAVVLRVESGGGSALASDRIFRAVYRLAQKKPVIASFGGVAASGGYYIAAPATEIVASASTVTGSIGLFYGKADLSGLLGKLDLGVTVLETGGERVDMESWHRPYTDEEVAFLEQQLAHFYNLFLERVSAGRGMTRDEVHELAQGRIWSGHRARELGLVDSTGGFLHAVARARALAGVPAWVPVEDLTPGPGLIEKILSGITAKASGQDVQDLAALLARSAGLMELFPTAMFLLREEQIPLALCPATLSF